MLGKRRMDLWETPPACRSGACVSAGAPTANLVQQRNLQQGSHQSQTLCAVYDGVTSALGADA